MEGKRNDDDDVGYNGREKKRVRITQNFCGAAKQHFLQ